MFNLTLEDYDLPTLCHRYPKVKQLYHLAQAYNHASPDTRSTHQTFFKAHHQPHPLWQLDRFVAPDQDPDHYYAYAVGLIPVWADDYDQAVANRAHHDPQADLNQHSTMDLEYDLLASLPHYQATDTNAPLDPVEIADDLTNWELVDDDELDFLN